MANLATTQFEAEAERYNEWRIDLARAVREYDDWLEGTNQLDVQQSIRFYDLLETLNSGRLLLAFLAEFSRGKSELINALFFSSFKEHGYCRRMLDERPCVRPRFFMIPAKSLT
jgi:hypothetical protein